MLGVPCLTLQTCSAAVLIHTSTDSRSPCRWATRIMVASRWPQRSFLTAVIRRSTSASVKYSRVRRSALGGSRRRNCGFRRLWVWKLLRDALSHWNVASSDLAHRMFDEAGVMERLLFYRSHNEQSWDILSVTPDAFLVFFEAWATFLAHRGRS